MNNRKYDTLRLLDGVPRTDEYQAEDIMQEFSRPVTIYQPATQQGQRSPQGQISDLEPPQLPTASNPSDFAFFTAPEEQDPLGEDFWSSEDGDDSDDLWAEIQAMGRSDRRKASRTVSTSPASREPQTGSTPREPQTHATRKSRPKAAPRTTAPAQTAEPVHTAKPAEKPERASARMRRRQLQEAEARTPKPNISPERAIRRYRQMAQSARRRLPILWVLGLLTLYFTLAGSFGWLAPAAPTLNRLLAILALFAPVLCFDLLVQTVYDLCHLRFRAETLVLAGTVASVADAFLSAKAGTHIPYCILPTLGWIFCLWGFYDRQLALRRTVKAMHHGSDSIAIRSVPELWNQTDCIVKTTGDTNAFINELNEPDYAGQIMQYYVPIVCIGSLILSLVVAFGRNGNFLRALAAMLAAAMPLAATLCYTRPFALLARRLYRTQSALCGWLGAELLGGRQAVIIQDTDLFPHGSVTMNGARFYEGYDQSYIISCAATVFHEAGGNLRAVFDKMAEDFHTGYGQMTSYRAYEGGGYGATIGQDIVLVGTVSFLRLMGIAIPDGTNLRQAVYVVINNQLAGVFSINYAPSRATRVGLDALCAQRRLINLFATRDFILNPTLLRQRFHLSGGRMEFPAVADRLRLSEPGTGATGRRAALLARDHFAGYSDTVAGGRLLYNLTRWSSLFCLISGIVGLVLIFILFYLDETLSATVTNLLLYCLLWALPPLLITSWVDKY